MYLLNNGRTTSGSVPLFYLKYTLPYMYWIIQCHYYVSGLIMYWQSNRCLIFLLLREKKKKKAKLNQWGWNSQIQKNKILDPNSSKITHCMDYSDRFRAQFSFKYPKSVWRILCNFCITFFPLPGAVYIVAIDLLIFDLCLCPVGVEEVAGTYPVYSVHRGVISLFLSLSLSICISHSTGMSHKQKLACSYETTATRQTSTMHLYLYETKRGACPVTV